MKNWKYVFYIALLCGTLIHHPLDLHAQSSSSNEEVAVGEMPPSSTDPQSERKAKMEERRAAYEKLSPEEKEQLKAELQEKITNFKSLSPEEKQAALHEAAAKRGANMTDEQKAQAKARLQKAKTKYQSLSEEQKQALSDKRKKLQEKRQNGGFKQRFGNR